jgi:hypothetical protein
VFLLINWVLADLGEPLAGLIVAWGCSAELGGSCGVPSSHSSPLRASASGPPGVGIVIPSVWLLPLVLFLRCIVRLRGLVSYASCIIFACLYRWHRRTWYFVIIFAPAVVTVYGYSLCGALVDYFNF